MDSNLSLAFYKLHVFRQISLSGASSNWKTSKTDDKMISKKKKSDQQRESFYSLGFIGTQPAEGTASFDLERLRQW